VSQPRDDRQDDLFAPGGDHQPSPSTGPSGGGDRLAVLAGRFGSVCRVGPGQPPLPTRLMAGLLILIRREMRRRAAVEPVIGHLKDDHRMRRNYLKGRDGDRINAVLAAAGYNFSLLRRWFEEFLRALLSMFCHGGTTMRPA
jgi:hypothetical protein